MEAGWMMISLGHWFGLFGLSVAAALCALWVSARLSVRSRTAQREDPLWKNASHLLFDEDRLLDHDISDEPVIDSLTSWQDISPWLQQWFGPLPDSLASVSDDLPTEFVSNPTGFLLRICRAGRLSRITLTGERPPSPAALLSMRKGVQTDQAPATGLDCSPDPVWCVGPSGQVLWRNAACAGLEDGAGALPDIEMSDATLDPRPEKRISIVDPNGGDLRWFKVRTHEEDTRLTHFATDITEVIKAETTQRDFVQTLTKTFANLTIGLAIFDRNRQLALFNPALFDLTHLPASFLSARPDLMNFFDQLRERQVMPEPRNYAEWRVQICDVVAQAKEGVYQDLWTVPNGLTYRVTGQPHPDGAIAFLFEDVSAEISLTRRFRAEIDLRQSVTDAIDEAIAVFSQGKVMVFCNQPFADMLGSDPDISFADMELNDLLAALKARFGTGEDVQALESRLISGRMQGPFSCVLGQSPADRITCRIKPLSGGAAMLLLSPKAPAISTPAIRAIV